MISRRSFLKHTILFGLSVKATILNGSINLKEYLNKVVTIDISSESTEGGEIKCFIENANIVKVVKSQCWEGGRYYLGILINDGNIVSVKERIEKYNLPFYVTKELAKEMGLNEHFDPKLSVITDNAYYFDKGCAVHAVSNTDKEFCGNELQQATNEYNSVIEDIKIQLNKSSSSA